LIELIQHHCDGSQTPTLPDPRALYHQPGKLFKQKIVWPDPDRRKPEGLRYARGFDEPGFRLV